MSNRPFFTIGVTTFKRKTMLVECVQSILDQSYSDFEVLIGNDCTSEKLSVQELGFADPRIKIFNHDVNLGEFENMNFLLKQSRGEYFTWLADDDAYHPHFFRIVHEAVRLNPAWDCVFTSYWSANVKTGVPCIDPEKTVAVELSVDQFLERYLTRQIAVIGCYGVFRSSFLRELGGMKRVGIGLGPYSDNLLGIKAAAMGRVAYIYQPLIFYRVHQGSLSCSSDSVEAYRLAQSDVMREFDAIVGTRISPELHGRLKGHLFEWFVGDLASVWGRCQEKLRPAQVWEFVRLARNSYIAPLPFMRKLSLITSTTRCVFMLLRKSAHDMVCSSVR